MIFNWLRRPPPRPVSSAAFAIPPGQRVYAVGDIHGACKLLVEMQGMIRDDLRAFPVRDASLVYLGDYIDRGEHSREVVENLLTPPAFLPHATMLRGNHEQTLLDCLTDPERLANWRNFGAVETLLSYGVDPALLRNRSDQGEAIAQLRANMPAAHLAFMNELPLFTKVGGYFFCHAGVRPGMPLARQIAQDILWIRGEFLESDEDHGACVVHGHTPASAPEVRHNRINVDTGACMSGKLTCVILEGETVRFLST